MCVRERVRVFRLMAEGAAQMNNETRDWDRLNSREEEILKKK